MTSSDMQDTPAGRRAAGADGPRSSQPKRRTFTAAYKLAMIEKYDAATAPANPRSRRASPKAQTLFP